MRPGCGCTASHANSHRVLRRGITNLMPALALALSMACGRPATEAECGEIVARIAELELRSTPGADPAEIEKQVAETKKEFVGKAQRECVGRRISDGALRCVRNAKTAEEIVHECLD